MHNSILSYTFKGNYALGKDGGKVIVWLIVSINRLSSWERYTKEHNWNFEELHKANPGAKGTKGLNAHSYRAVIAHMKG